MFSASPEPLGLVARGQPRNLNTAYSGGPGACLGVWVVDMAPWPGRGQELCGSPSLLGAPIPVYRSATVLGTQRRAPSPQPA